MNNPTIPQPEAALEGMVRSVEPQTRLSYSQRAADAVTEFCGSWTFIAVFSFLTAGWIALNTLLVFMGHFDPYPFILFNLVLTIVSTFQSPLIMMSQNRQIERDRIIVQGLHAKLDVIAARTNSTLACHQELYSAAVLFVMRESSLNPGPAYERLYNALFQIAVRLADEADHTPPNPAGQPPFNNKEQ